MADSPFLSFVDELLDFFNSSADVLHFGSCSDRKDHGHFLNTDILGHQSIQTANNNYPEDNG